MSLFFDLFRHDPHIQHLQEGETLFQEGEVSNGTMYVVASGQLSISLGEAVLEIAGAGAIIGEMALVEQRETRSASVRALTGCSLVVIDETRFFQLISDAPEFSLEIMRVMSNRLRKCDEAAFYNGSIGHQPWRVSGSAGSGLRTPS